MRTGDGRLRSAMLWRPTPALLLYRFEQKLGPPLSRRARDEAQRQSQSG